MSLGEKIYKLRTEHKLSQEKFGELFSVTPQSVQKWENDKSLPDLDKLIKIANQFNLSLDEFILDKDQRKNEIENYNKPIAPNFSKISQDESYDSSLLTEYKQSTEEGLDIEKYRDLFKVIGTLPKDENRKRLGDIAFDIVKNAKTVEGYKYNEPSTLDEIKSLRSNFKYSAEKITKEKLRNKIHGAVLGRICGCYLGKSVECIISKHLVPMLKEMDNYPMNRYILKSEIPEKYFNIFPHLNIVNAYPDVVDYMPTDDDTNYIVLAQKLINDYGKDFTSENAASNWVESQSRRAYCTAELVAYKNILNNFEPPQTAIYRNPFREWIGAQIRGDYFGYINPGNPEKAAEMAFRDASISHIKNGIYGEMYISAMLAIAAVNSDIKEIILGGLAQIPKTSRLYENIMEVLNDYENGKTFKEVMSKVHERYPEETRHGLVHTISNAMIVTAVLLYGNLDYSKSICMAVEVGYDTDCNGATVGSVVGMIKGVEAIDEKWSKPLNNTLETRVFGMPKIKITDLAENTLKHIDL